MQVGDLVRITQRGPELFLVLGRSNRPRGARYGDTSKFSDWLLIEIATGRKFCQNKRELEVVSENR
jgi:hypothetical protein